MKGSNSFLGIRRKQKTKGARRSSQDVRQDAGRTADKRVTQGWLGVEVLGARMPPEAGDASSPPKASYGEGGLGETLGTIKKRESL